VPKILNFPFFKNKNLTQDVVFPGSGSEFAITEDIVDLSPEAKRHLAAKLVVEAASLLKSISNRDAEIAELLVDCLMLQEKQETFLSV